MAFKVCVAWAISAVALLVSSALASPALKGSSQEILPSAVVAADDGVTEGALEGEQNEEEETEEQFLREWLKPFSFTFLMMSSLYPNAIPLQLQPENGSCINVVILTKASESCFPLNFHVASELIYHSDLSTFSHLARFKKIDAVCLDLDFFKDEASLFLLQRCLLYTSPSPRDS